MFDFDEFLAKARVYFSRASNADDSSEEQALWLSLGLEFLLRAPLAKVHPTLLALPEGDSILHAAGIERARGAARSIPTKTVIDRLAKIDPDFGDDRAKDSLFVTELRNEELHSSRSTFATATPDAWMPKFINAVEAICNHLGMAVEEVLSAELAQAAREYRTTADAQTQGQVRQLSAAARTLYAGLSPTEIAARKALPSPLKGATSIECPICHEDAAWLSFAGGRSTQPTYDEDDSVIRYSVVSVVSALSCTVCHAELATTAQVIAAGIDRLHVDEIVEDRYEGWEELMTYDDAMNFLGADDYGND